MTLKFAKKDKPVNLKRLKTHRVILSNVRYEMGYASAAAVVLFLLMFLSWKLINKLLSKISA